MGLSIIPVVIVFILLMPIDRGMGSGWTTLGYELYKALRKKK